MIEYLAVTKGGYEVEVNSDTVVGDTVKVEFIDGSYIMDEVESIRAIDYSKYRIRDDD